jgi:hypothetical protein
MDTSTPVEVGVQTDSLPVLVGVQTDICPKLKLLSTSAQTDEMPSSRSIASQTDETPLSRSIAVQSDKEAAPQRTKKLRFAIPNDLWKNILPIAPDSLAELLLHPARDVWVWLSNASEPARRAFKLREPDHGMQRLSLRWLEIVAAEDVVVLRQHVSGNLVRLLKVSEIDTGSGDSINIQADPSLTSRHGVIEISAAKWPSGS